MLLLVLLVALRGTVRQRMVRRVLKST